jgi:hypothetical protein
MIVPHCYDVDYIIYSFAQKNIDIIDYISKEDLYIFIGNCLKAAYLRLVSNFSPSIKVVTNSFSGWVDIGSIGDINITPFIGEKQYQFSLVLCQRGYECTLYKTSRKSNPVETVIHRCVLCRNYGDTYEQFLEEHPEILKYSIEVIKEGPDKFDFDFSQIKPVFDTRELPKLLRFENLRAYVLKILGGENPCNAEVIPLNF